MEKMMQIMQMKGHDAKWQKKAKEILRFELSKCSYCEKEGHPTSSCRVWREKDSESEGEEEKKGDKSWETVQDEDEEAFQANEISS